MVLKKRNVTSENLKCYFFEYDTAIENGQVYTSEI